MEPSGAEPTPFFLASEGGLVITVISENVSRCSSRPLLTRLTCPRSPSGTSWPVAACSRQPCTSNSLGAPVPPTTERMGDGCIDFFHTCSECESRTRESTSSTADTSCRMPPS